MSHLLDTNTYNILCYLIILSAVFTFLFTMKFEAPYGKFFVTKKYGPLLSNRSAWIVMELPCFIVFSLIFYIGDNKGVLPILFFISWQLHYGYRSLVYPLRIRYKDNYIPLCVALIGSTFTVINAFVNALWISSLADYEYPTGNIVGGMLLFTLGFFIHLNSDEILLRLSNTSQGYRIPQGKLFQYISSPNYLGEILQWTGWAIATYSLSGLAFAIFTFANLFPRALRTHRWYQSKFTDYPKNRKAIIPFLL